MVGSLVGSLDPSVGVWVGRGRVGGRWGGWGRMLSSRRRERRVQDQIRHAEVLQGEERGVLALGGDEGFDPQEPQPRPRPVYVLAQHGVAGRGGGVGSRRREIQFDVQVDHAFPASGARGGKGGGGGGGGGGGRGGLRGQ